MATEQIFNNRRIAKYEKKVKEINEFYLEYKSQFEDFKKRVSTPIRKFDSFTTQEMSHVIPDLAGIGGDIKSKPVMQLKKYYSFSKYLDAEYPEFSKLDIVSKINKLIEMINKGEKLSNGLVAHIFNLSVLSSKKYKVLYAKFIGPNLDKKLKFPESFIAAIKKSKLKIKPENLVEMLDGIKDYKDNLTDNLTQEFAKSSEKNDDIFLMYISDNLRKQYIEGLRSIVVSKRKSEYYKKTKNFDRYMDYRFPEMSFLKYDKKLEKLLEKADSDESYFSNEALIDLLYLSAQVSTKYNDIYVRLSSSTKLSDLSAQEIMEKLSSMDIALNPKDMIEKLYTFDKFFTYGYDDKEINSRYIIELQNIGFIDEEVLKNSDQVLEQLLPSAYALVKLACNAKLNITPYDVQLMGAIALNDGDVAQMYTGEGKSITAYFPAYLNSLTGKEVDIYTPNDYLASRDAHNASRVLESLGVSVGCVLADGQDKKEKQLAYSKNVVYGSSSAFAFDTISDSYEKENEGMVQRLEKPILAIIDEADQFFIDEALVPYKLDSNENSKDENEEVREYLLKAFDLATRLSEKQFSETDTPTDDSVRKYTGEELTKKFGLRFGTKEQLSELDDIQSNYYVVLGETDSAITDLGSVALFMWSNKEKIDELAKKDKVYFMISPTYEEGKDYLINGTEFALTETGLLKAINFKEEYASLERKWLEEENTQILMGYVKTQLKAFSMKKGSNDNGYDVRVNPETGKEEIVILQAGRVKEMSKYERGLHQALQLKEGLEIEMDERLTDSSFDSITIATLLSKYSKVCGMTGTADKEAFREIYHMDTIDIPKNADYQYRKKLTSKKPAEIIENPTVLYKDNRYKRGAIVSDILASRLTGQPVLMITDSNEEAKLIFERLKSYGIDEGLNLLISDRTLEEEAEIVARAGKIGSITIASEMAGRGTDIKLFSDNDREDARKLAKEEVFKNYVLVDLYIKRYGIDENESYRKSSVIRKFSRSIIGTDIYKSAINELTHNYETDKKLKQDLDIQIDSLANMMFETHKEKGLKLIQSKPFKTSRHDRQSSGRVGRQGEPGEVSLYASLSDLSSIGVSDEIIESISDGFFKNGNVSVTSDIVDEEIERAQSNTETIEDIIIASQTGINYAINSISTKFINTRKQLINTEDLTFSLFSMIEDTIDSVLIDNVPIQKRKKIKNNKRVSMKKLNVSNTLNSLNDIFGLELSPDSLSECKTVADFKYLTAQQIDKKISAAQNVISVKGFNEFVREQMLNGLNSTYDSFMYSAEQIKYQEYNDSIAQNSSKNRISDVNSLYNEVIVDGWKNIMGNIFNPDRKIEKEGTVDSPIIDSGDDPDMVSIDSFDEMKPQKK